MSPCHDPPARCGARSSTPCRVQARPSPQACGGCEWAVFTLAPQPNTNGSLLALSASPASPAILLDKDGTTVLLAGGYAYLVQLQVHGTVEHALMITPIVDGDPDLMRYVKEFSPMRTSQHVTVSTGFLLPAAQRVRLQFQLNAGPQPVDDLGGCISIMRVAPIRMRSTT
nr:hypothetical protein [bacterium]